MGEVYFGRIYEDWDAGFEFGFKGACGLRWGKKTQGCGPGSWRMGIRKCEADSFGVVRSVF